MKRKEIKDPPRSLQTSTQDCPAAPINSIISDNGGHRSICSQKFQETKRQFCKLIFILLCRSSTIIFDPILSDSLLKCMRETAQDLSTTQKLCIICSRQNFETVQVLCSVFCQPSTIFMHFSWFFFGRPSFFHPSFPCFTR